MIIVIVDNGSVVKKFNIAENAYGYAEMMMLKRYDVWVVDGRLAYKLGYM